MHFSVKETKYFFSLTIVISFCMNNNDKYNNNNDDNIVRPFCGYLFLRFGMVGVVIVIVIGGWFIINYTSGRWSDRLFLCFVIYLFTFGNRRLKKANLKLLQAEGKKT